MTALLVLVPVALLGTAGFVWLVRSLRSELGSRSSDVDRRLADVVETMDRRLGDLDTKVDRRLESASKTTEKIHERLGEVGKATNQMLERANDLARLEQALRPPKARGGFGELLLENLLRDQLPPAAYVIQHTFASGDRVDAVVRAGQLIPVDSKFPLDNFQRIVEARSDDERLLHE